ncbi:MAG: DUF4332 domain-containing protein [Planctomycetes bacterium]|nr:DUF4332 domain-containing protein [Planctomycetota bacterium]
MYIKDVAIDRYGAWAHLRLTDLDERLTVVYGVNGSGKSTIVRFLQAMLYGFPHFQESPAPAQSSPWGGSIAVEGLQGCCVIRRHDDGTRTGRLSLIGADGAPLERDALSTLVGGVDEPTFRLVYAANFRDPPPTETLVQIAVARGFEVAPPPIAAEIDAGDPSFDQKVRALRRRLNEVKSQTQRWRRIRRDVLNRRARLREEVMRWADAESPFPLGRDVQKQLGVIEQRLEHLQGEVREESNRGEPLVRSIREEVYQLCRRTHRRYLEQRRTSIMEEIEELRRCHREVRVQLQRLARRRAAIERALAERPVSSQARDWSDALVRRLRPAAPSLHATVFEEASEHLRRLTGGEFVRMQTARHEPHILLENLHGECLRLATQERSLRDCVHLAMCLALIEAHARRGVRLPLILDDALGRLAPQQAEQAGVLLREFAARGHQVLVFTCREAEARMLQRLGVPVLELPAESGLHEQRAWRWTSAPAPLETVAEAAAPAELLARIDGYPRPSQDRPGAAAARCFLDRNDAILYAPDIDKAAVESLASLGVETVGDFLALAPHAIAERLSPLEFSTETIRRWQATARLMCDTPNLRIYDARILAASGIASAEELNRLSSEELLTRVERCLESDEGRRLLALGDDEELTRLASWINAGRATQSLREAQRRNRSRRGAHAA